MGSRTPRSGCSRPASSRGGSSTATAARSLVPGSRRSRSRWIRTAAPCRFARSACLGLPPRRRLASRRVAMGWERAGVGGTGGGGRGGRGGGGGDGGERRRRGRDGDRAPAAVLSKDDGTFVLRGLPDGVFRVSVT